ncbi:MAG TPA: HlyD family type I secretion periplasmic adaptor subunit [Aurantimonas coralicida]|uniref:Membrane fusion protein (MFP) family protein n=2 Tax=root TaxID=1 RepID=A0A9C9NBP5_9HYPH|nr:HlyD family type I secretion periplasmic adaptor subunit [Aurantimonas coralicida]HET99074.1 HlyD family type I secretion periplasmic adaptor subunit [Aurantimonas coralicida]
MSVVAFRKPSEDPGDDNAMVVAPGTAPAPAETREDFNRDINRPILIGSIIVAIFIVGLGIWAALAPLGSAVIAAGVVKVEDSRKVVKTRDGGIIAQVLVKDGQTVDKGDVLVRMDDVQAGSAFAVYDNQYMNLIARRARFMAEGAGVDEVSYPPILIERKADPAITSLMTDQTALFDKRRQALDTQAEILQQRLAQLDTRISGYQAQIDAITSQNGLIAEELKGTKSLAARGYAPKTKVLELQRTAAGLTGQIGSLQAQIAEAQQAKGETQMQINRLYEDRLTEGSQGLSDIQGDLANILPRLQSAKATLDLTDVKAPASGTVFGLTQFTDGGVVGPGERILDIVPDNSPMIIQANIQPTDIAEISKGMEAEIKLTAYNQHTTPSVSGEIIEVSADRMTTEDGAAFYTIDIRVDPESLARSVQELRLYPGMPAQIIIPTSNRTALDYLISPITDSMNRAFREQ